MDWEPIGEIPECFPNYNYQAVKLKETKELFPEYKGIYHDVQQQNLKRLEKSWDRWTAPDKRGKRGGRPRFKKSGSMRSFTFPRVNCPKAGANIKEGLLTLSKIGTMPIILHRPFPLCFTAKTCTLVKKADGWYASISLEDLSVPTAKPMESIKTAVGVDVGLKEFLSTSTGETVPIQHNYRRSQRVLARQQRKLARQQKGSKNRTYGISLWKLRDYSACEAGMPSCESGKLPLTLAGITGEDVTNPILETDNEKAPPLRERFW